MIKSSMKISQWSYRTKLLLTFIVFSFLLTMMTGIIYTAVINKKIAHESLENAHLIASHKKLLFQQYTNDITNKLHAIKFSKRFQHLIANPGDKTSHKILSELFFNLCASDGSIMQLRYINNNADEIIRVDRDNFDTEPYLVANDELQKKGHRYYYHSILNQSPDEIWYSKIDLNIEHNKIDLPIRPVMRAGMPVYKGDDIMGILIINVFMHNILDQLTTSNSYDITMVDRNGDVLVSSDGKHNWSAYLNETKASESFKSDIKNILHENKNITHNAYIESLGFDNDEEIQLIFQPKTENIHALVFKEVKLITAILIFISVLSIPLAYLVSKKPIELEEALEKYNRHLEARIKKAVNEYEQSQKLLTEQTRLAQIGETLSMIAHQWRQPLGTIATIAGGLKMRLFKEDLTSETALVKLTSIEEHTQMLSKTINAFQDFYKPHLEESETSIDELIFSSIYIIQPALEHDNITVETSLNAPSNVKIYKQDLQQVILAILQNAREALLEHKKSHPRIKIETRSDDKGIQILISDNAGGIASKNISDIFMPYYSTKEKNGRGLGLYMAKNIIEKHHKGTLIAYNDGEWTVFTITIRQR